MVKVFIKKVRVNFTSLVTQSLSLVCGVIEPIRIITVNAVLFYDLGNQLCFTLVDCEFFSFFRLETCFQRANGLLQHFTITSTDCPVMFD